MRAGADDTFRLVNRSDGLCLNVLDGKTDEGSPVGAWPCSDTTTVDNEDWTVKKADPNQPQFTLRNPGSGRNLVVTREGR